MYLHLTKLQISISRLTIFNISLVTLLLFIVHCIASMIAERDKKGEQRREGMTLIIWFIELFSHNFLNGINCGCYFFGEPHQHIITAHTFHKGSGNNALRNKFQRRSLLAVMKPTSCIKFQFFFTRISALENFIIQMSNVTMINDRYKVFRPILNGTIVCMRIENNFTVSWLHWTWIDNDKR